MALSASTARSGSSRRRMAAILIPALTALTLSAPAAHPVQRRRLARRHEDE